MKLLKLSNGRVMAFGFDVNAQKPEANVVSWSSTEGDHWTPMERDADVMQFDFEVDPEFVRELNGGVVIAYQPGLCLEFAPVNDMRVFLIRVLKPE